ncbi:MAG TPA: phosphatidylinositol-specific phospholipase C domain-containing protein [Pseudonocardiaceae bacterium]|jgi:hypothetical protein|nr:phosphatidylinositol-specific phospholipase C domain-containing protein [Pseudonocardiaceae bacterium]
MLVDRVRWRAASGIVAGALLAISVTVVAGTPAQADPGSLPLSETTVTGIHNTYAAPYTYLAQALDAGAQMIELDTWDDVLTQEWKVSHSDPTGNQNNCVTASSPADIYTGSANKDFSACLDDIKYWLQAHPGAGPIYIKVENKDGFAPSLGMGPAQFTSYVNNEIGSILYRPSDLLGSYPSLDAAAKANAWPTRSQLAGKIIMYMINGAVEVDNPLVNPKSEVALATYDQSLYTSGQFSQATTFPAVLNAASGDPRTQFAASLQPYFVFFDGDANTYVTSIDTSFYTNNHYILTMTDAQNVAPVLDDTNPPVADAQARVAQLAADGASIVSNDWSGLPAVLNETLTRG